MGSKPEWRDHSIPAVYPQTYLRVAEERGASPEAILRRAGLNPAFIRRPSDLRMVEMQALTETVLAVVGDDGLGVDVGWYLPPTAFGSFGYALLCSETLRDALEITRRYWHLAGRGTRLSVQAQQALYAAEVTPAGPFPATLRPLVLEVTMTSLYHGFLLLTDWAVEGLEIWFDFPAPGHADKVRRTLGTVRYDMPVNQFRFPGHLLDTRLGMHNPAALKFALEQCEREDALLSSQADRVASRAREAMRFDAGGYPSLADLSRRLNLTARTLRRRLDREGTSYSRLLAEARRRDALRLLDDPTLAIQRVAEWLGYRDPANFTRAFRQWTGQTPSQYRATRRSV